MNQGNNQEDKNVFVLWLLYVAKMTRRIKKWLLTMKTVSFHPIYSIS